MLIVYPLFRGAGGGKSREICSARNAPSIERGDNEVFVPWAPYQDRGEKKAKKAAKTAKGVRLLLEDM